MYGRPSSAPSSAWLVSNICCWNNVWRWSQWTFRCGILSSADGLKLQRNSVWPPGLGLARRVAMSDLARSFGDPPPVVLQRMWSVSRCRTGWSWDASCLPGSRVPFFSGNDGVLPSKSSPCFQGLGILPECGLFGILWLCQKCSFISIPKPGWSQLTNRFGDGWGPTRDPRLSSTLWS